MASDASDPATGPEREATDALDARRSGSVSVPPPDPPPPPAPPEVVTPGPSLVAAPGRADRLPAPPPVSPLPVDAPWIDAPDLDAPNIDAPDLDAPWVDAAHPMAPAPTEDLAPSRDVTGPRPGVEPAEPPPATGQRPAPMPAPAPATAPTVPVAVLSPTVPAVGNDPQPVPIGDDLMPSRSSASRRARRTAQRRHRFMIGGAVVAAAALAGGGIAWAVTRDDGSHVGTRTEPRARTAPGRTRTTTTTDASGRVSTTTTVTVGAGASGATGTTTTSPSGRGIAGGTDQPPAVDVRAQITQSPGACRYDAAGEQLVDSGTVHNPASGDAIIEIDVSFSDATGNLDSAVDTEQVAPGETLQWEATTVALDPPSGSLSCSVTQG